MTAPSIHLSILDFSGEKGAREFWVDVLWFAICAVIFVDREGEDIYVSEGSSLEERLSRRDFGGKERGGVTLIARSIPGGIACLWPRMPVPQVGQNFP
jgi:hypothetical protein